MKRSFLLALTGIVAISLTLSDCNPANKAFPETQAPPTKSNIVYAGVRSSSYGAAPFPGPKGWSNAISSLTRRFAKSKPLAIWNVGVAHKGGCRLEFPTANKRKYASIEFEPIDRHETYLDYFDKNGISVFLQVEPGNADVKTLMSLVMERYRHHRCVIGFGLDVEWYKNTRSGNNGTPVDEDTVRTWEQKLKSINVFYKLFLKHFDKSYLGNYRGDVVFVDDSQSFRTMSDLLAEYEDFAAHFYPNTVLFQIGYPMDRNWWKAFDNPPATLGSLLASKTKQDCGIIWVDFTMRDVLHVE